MEPVAQIVWLKAWRSTLVAALAAAGVFVAHAAIAATPAAAQGDGNGQGTAQSVVKDGIRIDFSIVPVDSEGRAASGDPSAGRPLVAGRDAEVRLVLSDAASGTPLPGVRPAAWMDARKKGLGELSCRDKIEGFLQARLGYRPDIDLNSWYIVTLNDQPSLTVIDPLLGFGGQRTVAHVLLDGAGEDWAIAADEERIFVTIPDRRRVSVVDTGTWRVTGNVDLPVKPVTALLQTDQRYLWVNYPGSPDAAGDSGGVAAIDTVTLSMAARIPTGAGPHDIAVSDDNRFLAVTNAGAGTVTLVDVADLAVRQEVSTGGRPVSVSWSTLAAAFYVADAATGEILSVDPAAPEPVRARIPTAAGLAHVAVSADGRWAFAANRAENRVEIVDVSVNRVAQSIRTGDEPYHIAFTDEFAYIRAAGTSEIGIVPVGPLARGEVVDVLKVAAGRIKPGDAGRPESASPVAPTPDGNAVLISNPLDRTVYFYMEGMAAASGSFANIKAHPRGVTAISRALRETAPGEYRTAVRLPAAGDYDVAILLDTPRAWHCFSATAMTAPGGAGNAAGRADVEYLVKDRTLQVGVPTTLRFRVRDADSGVPRKDIDDLKVLAFLSPGAWKRQIAPTVSEAGIWEVSLTPPEPGLYYVFVKSQTLGAQYRDLPFLILQAEESLASDDGEEVRQ